MGQGMPAEGADLVVEQKLWLIQSVCHNIQNSCRIIQDNCWQSGKMIPFQGLISKDKNKENRMSTVSEQIKEQLMKGKANDVKAFDRIGEKL